MAVQRYRLRVSGGDCTIADLAATSAHSGWPSFSKRSESLGLMAHALGGSDARLLPLLDNPAALHRSVAGLASGSMHAGRWHCARSQAWAASDSSVLNAQP